MVVGGVLISENDYATIRSDANDNQTRFKAVQPATLLWTHQTRGLDIFQRIGGHQRSTWCNLEGCTLSAHNPATQVSYLQQCLTSAKRPIGFFLGAGCPMAIRNDECKPLIPDIEQITKDISKQLHDSKDFATVLRNLACDGLSTPNIEEILTHVRGLRSIVGNGTARGLTASQLDSLDTQICENIRCIVDHRLPSNDTPYHKLATWIKGLQRKFAIEIFTTNYDLLIEESFEQLGVPYFDGFAGSRTPYIDIQTIEENDLPSRWARLWKLHGSINWYDDSERIVRGEGGGQNLVIYPSHLKSLQIRRLPYLTLMDRLKAYLTQPSAVLIVCGYSFGDEHINEVLIQGLQSSQTTAAFALMFDSLDNSRNAVKLGQQQPNLSVLTTDGAVIGTQKNLWSTATDTGSLGESPVDVSSGNADTKDDQHVIQPQFELGRFEKLGEMLHSVIRLGPANAWSEDDE